MGEPAHDAIALAKVLHDEVNQELVAIGYSVDSILIAPGLSIEAREIFRTLRGEISELALHVRDDIYDLNKAEPRTTEVMQNSQTIHRYNGDLRTLTKTELEILHLIATGATTFEIARMRHNSQATVKTHLTAIYRKLEVRNRVEAIAVLKS